MAKKAYRKLEEHIIRTFQRNRIFEYNNKVYELIRVGKPYPQGKGECKTDVFAEIRDQENMLSYEIKISVKTEGKQEFQENKVTRERAEAYFGENWEEIICEATRMLRGSFERRALLYASDAYPTKKNSVTVGWKLEFANKPRALSVQAPLTDREIREYVYKGTNQALNKRDSVVNGEIIRSSGIANYLLITTIDKIHTVNDVLRQMIYIDDMELDDIYLVFTANNYRTDVDKADGPRPLAVRVEWQCSNRKLVPVFCYDYPLKYTGERDMAPLVKNAFRSLGKSNVTDIDPMIDLESADFYKP